MSILVAEDGGEAAGAVLRAERVERVEEGVMRADGSSGRGEKERGGYEDNPPRGQALDGNAGTQHGSVWDDVQ